MTTHPLDPLLALSELRLAAARVVRAFEALGNANGFMDSRAAHLECERAMVALKDELHKDQNA